MTTQDHVVMVWYQWKLMIPLICCNLADEIIYFIVSWFLDFTSRSQYPPQKKVSDHAHCLHVLPFFFTQFSKASYPSPCLTLPVPVFSFSPSLMSLSHPHSLISLSPLLPLLNLLPPSVPPLISSRVSPPTYLILLCITPSQCPSFFSCSFVSSSLSFFFLSLTHPAYHEQNKAEGQCCHMTETRRPDWSSSAL